MSDLNGWDEKSRPFKRVSPALVPNPIKPTWSYTLTLPRDAYLEYVFHDPATQTRFLDPLNHRSVNNGVGSRNNFFYMPEAGPTPLTLRRAGSPVGALTKHRVETKWLRDDSERQIYLYKPPVKESVPLLVVYDGQDYLQRAKLAVIVDNMIAGKHIQPIAMAFLPSAGRWRNVEYACSDATILWVDQMILPFVSKKLNLLNIEKHPGAYGVLGASLGGTMSLYTGMRMPEVFGRVISQSGSFMIESLDFAVVDLVRYGQAQDINIWMDVGRFDELLEDNRNMHALLEEKGYQVTYHEYSGAHNYTAWRDDIAYGLEAMFPYNQWTPHYVKTRTT
ncbi:MAG: alpha/beta hydrolase-fold protein [Chloroflexota bacterium]|nr:alpha/beta hydrolase-fold protein [Chloroflexota bacterium]